MILGRVDQERVATAELQVIDLVTEAAEWRRRFEQVEARALHAEGRVLEETAYSMRVAEWGQGLAAEVGRQLAEVEPLRGLASAILKLHTESDAADVCRHCGHAWPCPTVAAVPSSA